MSSLKRMISWVLVILMVSTFSYGAGKYSEVKALILDDVTIVVEGQTQILRNTDGSKISPISYNGRIYLPVRSTADLLNYNVQWVDSTRTVDLSSKTNTATEDEGMGYASLAAVSYTAGMALKDRDYAALSKLAHPTKGIRFSFNGEVVQRTDVVLTSADLASQNLKTKIFDWGVLDGSSETYKVTIDTFLGTSARDFENAKRTGWNQRVTTRGINTLPATGLTVLEGGEVVYNGAEFVEYYYEGDPQVEFDWRSDVLVFDLYNGQYYLVGVIQNYWLI